LSTARVVARRSDAHGQLGRGPVPVLAEPAHRHERRGHRQRDGALLTTSAVMLTVGLLACSEPARRALRIQPIEVLKEA
jgi:hypothetical protein